MVVNALLIDHRDAPCSTARVSRDSQDNLARDVLDKCRPIVSEHRDGSLVGPLKQRMDLRGSRLVSVVEELLRPDTNTVAPTRRLDLYFDMSTLGVRTVVRDLARTRA